MFWYILLMALFVLFGVAALVSVALFIISGCECPEILIVTLVLVIISFGFECGATAVEDENTTINVDTVQMEVTKCDITSVNYNGVIQQKYYVTVGDKHIVNVNAEEYAELNVGDVVTVEIITTTKFGEVQKTRKVLKR